MSFVVLKEDGYSIDAIGTYSSYRGTGAAKSLVEYCINLAVERSDEEYYEIDSLISSILFWRKLGFEVVPAREVREIPKGDTAFYAFNKINIFH